MRRGYTTAGPHRDDFEFALNEKDVASYGSSGQQRAVVLALKMSEIEIFENERKQKPVLLLDDIDTELDVERINRAIDFCSGERQVLVSTTKPELLTKLEKDAGVIRIAGGRVLNE